MKRTLLFVLLLSAVAMGSGLAVLAQQASGEAPQFSANNELIRPKDYREWVYVTSGLGMTYGTSASASTPKFDNVFVNPSAYRSFMQTGRWPAKAMFILEIRNAGTQASINKGGHFQGDLVAIEAAVKDETRFPEKWAYFSFGTAASPKETAAALPRTARCYECHQKNTAVEQTFVQFYPTLFEVARRMGTVKPSYEHSPPAP